MIKKVILPVALAAFAWACGSNETVKNANETQRDTLADARFDRYKESFVEELWKVYPDWATGMGYRKYDSVLRIPNEAARTMELSFIKAHLDSLNSFKTDGLSSLNRIDYHLIENQLKGAEWSLNKLKAYVWNPSQYNLGESFFMILSGKHAPLEERLRMIYLKLANVPAYYEAAKQNIKDPTIEHTELAISQVRGSVSIFQKSILDSLRKVKMGAHESQAIEARVNEVIKAIKGYADWLEKDVRPQLNKETAKSFRIGKELYDEKFTFDIQSGFTAEEIYKKALARKAELHKEMFKLAKQLWDFPPSTQQPDSLKMIKMVIEKLSVKHVHRDSFQAAIEKQIPELTEFINKKGLVTLDPTKPLVVRREPDYMAGVAGASISAPGPYDKGGNTYYNVGSLSGWTAKDAESYLREYNHYILQILNIHEAIPGHYTQLVYSNQSPSIIKSIFGNGAMIEGWAVYTERMMLEEGYGNNDPAMWLMYYKWHLRTVCNTILDYSVHVKGMTEKEAMDLLVNQAFQEEAEAKGKWRRVTLTSVQLCSYFTGYTEIFELREELKKKLGDKFNLREFHEKFLSYGSAPVKYIRQLMIEEVENGKWPKK
jgi:uncharacterized protein (DUF885 family)